MFTSSACEDVLDNLSSLLMACRHVKIGATKSSPTVYCGVRSHAALDCLLALNSDLERVFTAASYDVNLILITAAVVKAGR